MADMNGMNDPMQRQGPYANPINGQPSSVPGSSGFGGAIMDLLAALIKHGAPRQLMNRDANVNNSVNQAAGEAPQSLGSQIGQ